MKIEDIQKRYNKFNTMCAQRFWARLIFQYSLIARSVYPEADKGHPKSVKVLKAVNESVLSVSKQLQREIGGSTETEQDFRLLTELLGTANKFGFEESLSLAFSKALAESEKE